MSRTKLIMISVFLLMFAMNLQAKSDSTDVKNGMGKGNGVGFMGNGAMRGDGQMRHKFGGMNGRQGPGIGMFIRSLDLSEEQLAKIQELQKAHQEKMKAKREEVFQGAKPMDLFANPDATDAELRKLHQQRQSMRTEMDNERFEMMLSIRKILTDEQKKKAAELMKKRMDMRQGCRGGKSCMSDDDNQ